MYVLQLCYFFCQNLTVKCYQEVSMRCNVGYYCNSYVMFHDMVYTNYQLVYVTTMFSLN